MCGGGIGPACHLSRKTGERPLEASRLLLEVRASFGQRQRFLKDDAEFLGIRRTIRANARLTVVSGPRYWIDVEDGRRQVLLKTLIQQPASRAEEELCIRPASVLFAVYRLLPPSH